MMFWSQQHSISLKQMHDLQHKGTRFHPNFYCHRLIFCIGGPPTYDQVGQVKCLSNIWVSLCRTSLPVDIAVRGNVRFTYFESFKLHDCTRDIPRPFISTTLPVKMFSLAKTFAWESFSRDTIQLQPSWQRNCCGSAVALWVLPKLCTTLVDWCCQDKQQSCFRL